MDIQDRPGAPRERTIVADHRIASLWTTAGLVETDRSLPEVRDIEADHQAIVGEPAPMALFGFAVGTLIVGMLMGGTWPIASAIGVVPALLWFAGVGQFIGGLFALSRGSTFAATTFCSFGMGNIIVGTFTWMQHAGSIPPAGAATMMLGVALICLGYIALMISVAARRTNMAYMLTAAALIPGYTLVGIQNLGGSLTVGHIGGWFLVLAALLAFYAGGAVVVNSQWCREVLPLGKFAR